MQSTIEPYGHRNWEFTANTKIFFLKKARNYDTYTPAFRFKINY